MQQTGGGDFPGYSGLLFFRDTKVFLAEPCSLWQASQRRVCRERGLSLERTEISAVRPEVEFLTPGRSTFGCVSTPGRSRYGCVLDRATTDWIPSNMA